MQLRKLVMSVLLVLSTFGSSVALACQETSLEAINHLARGLSSYTNPTVSNARAIISIAESCDRTRVRVRAAEVLARALSSYTNPTVTVAKDMVHLCGDDRECALAAIHSLSKGVSNYTRPTVSVVDVIVELVYQAPHQKVKSLAISVISGCVSSYTQPTKHCSAAIAEIGRCQTWLE